MQVKLQNMELLLISVYVWDWALATKNLDQLVLDPIQIGTVREILKFFKIVMLMNVTEQHLHERNAK